MRLGIGGGRTPPHKAAGYALIIIGAIIMVAAMPLFVYVAVAGALIVYVGYTLRGR